MQRKCDVLFATGLSVSTSEAEYLEEQTRLQSQSILWFEHRIGRITASKFAAVSKANKSSPPLSLVKTLMGETRFDSSKVPALQWGAFQ